MIDVTLITPTRDQPMGIGLCEVYMARQTYAGTVQWIVVDDGDTPATLTRGQTHVRRAGASAPGPISFCQNLLAAIPLVQGAAVAIIEHDDYYAPNHLDRLVAQLSRGALIAGDDEQVYYHVHQRCWRRFQNIGASLCQTGFQASLLPLFERIVQITLRRQRIGVDYAFWQAVPDAVKSLERTATVVGIKGLPGRPGLGIGHRPNGHWTHDPDGRMLRQWIGADADRYLGQLQGVTLIASEAVAS